MDKGKILAGLLAGAAAGAALVLLFAPGKTSDTKKAPGKKEEDYKEVIKENVVNFLFRLIDKLTAEKQKT
jgi:gas vesicle protein